MLGLQRYDPKPQLEGGVNVDLHSVVADSNVRVKVEVEEEVTSREHKSWDRKHLPKMEVSKSDIKLYSENESIR